MTIGLLSFSSNAQIAAWKQFPLGAGGFLRGVDIAADDSMLAYTDTYGAYQYDTTGVNPGNAGGLGVWRQLVAPSRFPTGDAGISFSRSQTFAGQGGCYEARYCHGNSNIIYLGFNGYLYKSTNKGASFVNLNASFTPASAAAAGMMPNDGPLRTNNCGPKLAVDPINPNIVYFSLGSGRAWFSLDGGVTWTQFTSGINAPTSGNFTCFAWDRRVAQQSGGQSNRMFAFPYGDGCYITTNAGQTGTSFTKISGSGTSNTALTTVRQMYVDSQGILWLTDNSGGNDNLWSWNGTAWTSYPFNASMGLNMPQSHSIAEDPTVANAQRIVVGSKAGILCQTQNGGTSWDGGFSNGTAHDGQGTRSATDLPALGVFTDDPTNGDMKFTSDGKLRFASGYGYWDGNPPSVFTGVPWSGWQSRSAGIEQLVANMIVSPVGGQPIAASFDRAFYKANYPSFPLTDQPKTFVASPGGVSVDWASQNPSTIVGVEAFGGMDVSQDGGVTWSTQTSPSNNIFQAVAAQTATNWMIKPNGGNLQYTLNGTAWNDTGSYFNTNFGIALNSVTLLNNEQTICADRVTALTFYTNIGTKFFRTQDGGATWSLMSTAGVASGITSGIFGVAGNPMLRSVLGKSGHVIWCGGQTYQGSPPSHPYTANGNTAISLDGMATWSEFGGGNARDIWGIGTGPQVGSYPRIAFWGYVKVGGVFTFGVWYTDDMGTTFSTLGDQTAYDSFDLPKWIEVDSNNANVVYIGMTGSGFKRWGI